MNEYDMIEHCYAIICFMYVVCMKYVCNEVFGVPFLPCPASPVKHPTSLHNQVKPSPRATRSCPVSPFRSGGRSWDEKLKRKGVDLKKEGPKLQAHGFIMLFFFSMFFKHFETFNETKTIRSMTFIEVHGLYCIIFII